MCVYIFDMEKISDSDYIEKIRKGETKCFSFLLERYSVPVFSLIVKIVGSREDAEELTQDVFVKAFRSLSSFRGESKFSTWIYRIAYNMAISATRKKKKEFTAIDETMMLNVPDESEEILSEKITSEEQISYLERALEQLPPKDKGLILLYYKESKSMEEVAAITGLTVTNVKTRIFRVRKKLQLLIKMMEEKKDE